jgi:hypothetical protein
LQARILLFCPGLLGFFVGAETRAAGIIDHSYDVRRFRESSFFSIVFYKKKGALSGPCVSRKRSSEKGYPHIRITYPQIFIELSTEMWV